MTGISIFSSSESNCCPTKLEVFPLSTEVSMAGLRRLQHRVHLRLVAGAVSRSTVENGACRSPWSAQGSTAIPICCQAGVHKGWHPWGPAGALLLLLRLLRAPSHLLGLLLCRSIKSEKGGEDRSMRR